MIDQNLIEDHRREPSPPIIRYSGARLRIPTCTSRLAKRLIRTISAPQIVQDTMDQFAQRVGRVPPVRIRGGGRRPQCHRDYGVRRRRRRRDGGRQTARGEKVGLLKVRLYRPFDGDALITLYRRQSAGWPCLTVPKSRAPRGAALPGCPHCGGRVLACAATMPMLRHSRGHRRPLRFVLQGIHPCHGACGIYVHLKQPQPKRHFTVGIYDDVTHLSLPWDAAVIAEPVDVARAVFYGLGSDGTVGASKNSVKIVGENTPLFAQGYFVYDSKKAGSVTVSHLRLAPGRFDHPIYSTTPTSSPVISFTFLEQMDVLKVAAEGATFLLNSPYGADAYGNNCRAKSSSRSSTSSCGCSSSTETPSPSGPACAAASTPRCKPVFRAVRGVASGRSDRAHQGRHSQDLRQARRNDRRSEFRRD